MSAQFFQPIRTLYWVQRLIIRIVTGIVISCIYKMNPNPNLNRDNLNNLLDTTIQRSDRVIF